MLPQKRIAQNTLFLYIRMLIIMIVKLFTVRVVLDVLGATDYGIFNVIGGVVTLFSFLTGTMSSATQRFFAYELGQNNYKRLNQIFSLNIILFAILIGLFLVISETAGLWFINTKLTIPAERLVAANWVYQCAIISFVASIITVPYNALILAHEKMSAYAYISIVEAFLQLGILFLLYTTSYDKLKSYAVLMLITSSVIALTYYLYCRINFKESKFAFFWDKQRAKELISYCGWHFLGSTSSVVRMQGVNILLNMFFNPAVNAARAIAYQVNAAVISLSNNFFVAVQPQIYKTYSANKVKEMNTLVFQSSKLCFYLMMLLFIPCFLETEFILNLWLTTVPEHTVVFVKLVIVNAFIESINGPVNAAAMATGRIKKYELVMSGLMLLNLPISYIFLKLGAKPESTMIISIIISVISVGVRGYLLRGMVNFPLRKYIKEVLLVISMVVIIAMIIPVACFLLVDNEVLRFLSVCGATVLSSILSVYAIGLKRSEREKLTQFVLSKLNFR